MANWWVCHTERGVLHVAGNRRDAVIFLRDHNEYNREDPGMFIIVREDRLNGLGPEQKTAWREGRT